MQRLSGKHLHIQQQRACHSGSVTPKVFPAVSCGAHLLRDLKGLYGFEPQKQEWAARMADLLIEARAAAAAARLACQFGTFEDLILHFATRPDLDIFTNNQAERTIRPVKVQQGGSGGAWRTLDGLADFAIVSPTYPPPQNGASPNSTPSATCSTAIPGNHPDLNPPDNRQRPAHVTSRR
jgi:Transposase IS66 family